MISKDELRMQIEDILGLCDGDLIGENIKETLKDIDGGGVNVYWGCISKNLLNDTF